MTMIQTLWARSFRTVRFQKSCRLVFGSAGWSVLPDAWKPFIIGMSAQCLRWKMKLQFIYTTFCHSGVLKSGGGISNYSAGLIQSLIELNLAQAQLNVYRTAYKDRMKLVCQILRDKLPNECSFVEPSGGYFIWIRLPEHCIAMDFNEIARTKYRVITISSDVFSVTKKIRNCIRISIGFQTYERLAHAVPILCRAITEFVQEKA